MISLKLLLSEAQFHSHYSERKDLRVNRMLSIEIPGITVSDEELERVKAELLVQLLAQCKLAESTPWTQTPAGTGTIVLVARMQYQQGTTRYPIYVTTLKEPQSATQLRGDCYYIFINENTIYTIVNAEYSTWFETAASSTKRLYPGLKTITRKEINSAQIIIGAAVEKTVNQIDPADLDYEVKSEYRVWSPKKPMYFTHKKYGQGKIVATSAGNTGLGDSRGVVDWIEVDFGKPYLSSGKFLKTRRINNVYTTAKFKD